MPLAPVGVGDAADASNVQLYYEDSGAPPNCLTYTTLVFLHGTGFHGGGPSYTPILLVSCSRLVSDLS